MDKKELEKYIDVEFKSSCKNLAIPNYQLKVKKRLLEIWDESNILVGELHYSYSSSRFCELGATTTLHLSISIKFSIIGEILKNIGINYNIPPYIGYSMVMARYKFPRNQQYLGGSDFSFYTAANIEERIKDFISPIKNDIIPRIDNYLNHRELLLDDIINKQDYYKYPYASILISLYLNKMNTVKNIEELRERAKQAKLYDIRFADEINEKVFRYFNTNSISSASGRDPH